MVDRVDAGGGKVGIAGEIVGAVDKAAGEAVGLGRVGLGRTAASPSPPSCRAAREGVQERVDAGAGDVGMPGEVGGGVEVGARVAARAPAMDEVVAHRVDRDPVPARVERRVKVWGQGGDLRVRGDEIVRCRQAAAGRQPDQRVAARADRAGACPAMVQAADPLQRAAARSVARRPPIAVGGHSAIGTEIEA